MSGRRETQREEEIVPAEGDERGAAVGCAQVEEATNGVAGPRQDDEIELQQQPQEGLQIGDEQQKNVRWYKRKIRKAKTLFLSPFRKIKEFYTRRFRSAHYYYGDDPGGCCCRCVRPPPAISPPRLANLNNPNCKNLSPSSYEFIKILIERNDFYAPQCNAHRGISTAT